MDEATLHVTWSRALGHDPRATDLRPEHTFRGRLGPAQASDDAPVAVDELGAFRLLERVGRGGVGIVYRSRDVELQREVALKLLRPREGEEAPEPDVFVHEARITGLLEHPNIVPVHCLGTREEKPYFAMKLVRGENWRDLLERSGDDLDRHLEILLQVCNAVAFAHSRGIVHNDLKPSNVMVGAFGEVLVVDWGLACCFEEEARPGLRHKSAVREPCGTPHYMPPELACGDGDVLGPWTDIYLLGGILYRLLTGHAPHARGSFFACVFGAAGGRAESLPEDCPEALRALVVQTLEPDRRCRLASVEEFQQALRTFLAQRETRTRARELVDEAAASLARATASPGTGPRDYEDFSEAVNGFRQARRLWEHAAARAGEEDARRTWARAALASGDIALAAAQADALDDGGLRAAIDRARRQASREHRQRTRLKLGAGALLLLVLAVAVYAFLTGRARDLEAERRRASERAAWQVRLATAGGLYDRALDQLRHGRLRHAGACLVRALELVPPGPSPPGLDDGGASEPVWALLRHVRARLHVADRLCEGHEGAVLDLAFASDGKTLVSSGRDKSIRLWSVAEGRELRSLLLPREARRIEIAPDGLRLFVDEGGLFGKPRLVALSDGAELQRLPRSFTERVTPTGQAAEEPLPAAWGTSFGAGGMRVAASRSSATIRIWDTAGSTVATCEGHTGEILDLQLSPDEGRLVSVATDATLRLWDSATGSELWRLDLGRCAWRVAFDDFGTGLAVAFGDGEIVLYDLVERTLWARYEGPTSPRLLSFGRSLIAASREELVRISADGDRDRHELALTGMDPRCVALSADGSRVAVGCRSGLIRLFELDSGGGHAVRGVPLGVEVASAAFARDGRALLVGGDAGRVLEVRLDGSPPTLLGDHGAEVVGTGVSADARRGVSIARNGSLHVWDLDADSVHAVCWPGAGDQPLLRADGLVWMHPFRELRGTPWERWRAVVEDTARVRPERPYLQLLDPRTGAVVARHTAWGPVGVLGSDPDGARALGISFSNVWLLDLQDGSRDPWSGELKPSAVVFDGERLLIGTAGGVIASVRAATGEILHRYGNRGFAVELLALAPDRRSFVSLDAAGRATLWDTRSGRALTVLDLREALPVASSASATPRAVAYAPDSARVWIVRADGTLFCWQVFDPVEEPPADISSLYDELGYRMVSDGAGRGRFVPLRGP